MALLGDMYNTLTPSRMNDRQIQDGTASIVGSMYHECSDGEGVPMPNFCHFLAHLRLFDFEFHHKTILQTFLKCTGGALQQEEFIEDRRLDPKSFRAALQAVAIHLYGAAHGLHDEELAQTAARRQSRMANEASAKVQALQDMMRDVSLRNSEGAFNLQKVSGMRSALFNMEVIDAAYEYAFAMRKLFSHYAVEPTLGSQYSIDMELAVNARSAYRLCRAMRLVPDCVVAGEFHDVAATLRSSGGGRHQENKFFQEEKMFQRAEDQNWLQPARNALTGEPRYSFPELVELLVVAAMHAPPRMYKASPEERVSRIHQVFGDLLALPRAGDNQDFDAESYLQVASKKGMEEPEQTLLRTPQPEDGQRSLASIFEELDAELPHLGPKQDPHIPQPSASILDKLPPQPPTADERIAAAQKKAALGKPGTVVKKKGKKSSKKTKEKKTFTREGPVVWDQIQWLGKRPVPQPPTIPLMWQTDSKVSMLKHLEDQIHLEEKEAQSHNVPFSGVVLRMQLIDEPLRAPPCEKSEQVSTLIETALTSRRLRQYDAAIVLLIRARRLWAALEAGRSVPSDWADVQPLVPTPSPWAPGPGLGSPTTGPRQQRYAPANVQEGQGGALQSELVAVDVPIRGQAPSPASLLDCTILPGELRRNSQDASGSQTARPSMMSIRNQQGFACSPSPETIGGSSGSRPNTGGGWSSRQDATPSPAVGAEGPPAGDGSSTFERRQRLMAARAARESQESRTPKSARGRSPSCRVATHNKPTERRYDPKLDFSLALGEGESDLDGLPAEAALFFFCELASLHSAVHEDDLSVLLLWRAHADAKRLPANDANAAVVWCGLGRVAFHMGQFELAARLHMRGRSIRERTLGGDTIDTATSYNNLACCLAALERPVEAAAFIELAAEILKELAGEDHPRTQTAIRNLTKARNAPKKMALEVPHLFSLPVRDHNKLLRKGRRRKKKSKSRSKSRGSKSRGSSRSSKKSSKGKK